MTDRDRSDALRLGLQRAGLHWLRAGYEVLAGVGALLDELVRAARPDDEDQLEQDLVDPTHIDLE